MVLRAIVVSFVGIWWLVCVEGRGGDFELALYMAWLVSYM